MKSIMKWINLIFIFFFLAIPAAFSLTITSKAPGNIFVAGKSVQFTITNASDIVNYSLVDYFTSSITSGNAIPENSTTEIRFSSLNPGWYELRCQDSLATTSVSLGVVIDRKNAPLPKAGRVCADAASAWLIKNDAARKPFARIVKLAGIPWVRERLGWADVENEPGKFDWRQYQTVADTLAAEGIHISQIWHDSPAWARVPSTKTSTIADLRDVYRFTRAAAKHFANQIDAWEVWNEPDGGFWQGLADRFAGLQKAAYLGIKDGNPNAMVLQGSFCTGVHQFAHNFCESGTSGYFDIFNWHDYAKPETYPTQLQEYYRSLPECNLSQKPAWMTEAGIPLHGIKENHILNPEDQHKQCRYVPQSLIMSFAAGNEKNFFFVLPDYLENGNQFGALHPDLTPYPAFIALSAAANILGLAEYIGEYKTDNPLVTAHLFRSATGTILTLWSNEATVVQLPTKKNAVRTFNIFGHETVIYPINGNIKISVGPEVIYLVDADNLSKSNLFRPSSLVPRPLSLIPHPSSFVSNTSAVAKQPARIVIMGYSNLPFEKEYSCYKVEKENPFNYMIEVYNFDEQRKAEGRVSIEIPKGWKAGYRQQSVQLKPMDRKIISFSITPKMASPGTLKITSRMNMVGGNQQFVAPAVSYFRLDYAQFHPVKHAALDWANDATHWIPESSTNGKVIITPSFADTIRVDATFSGTGDRWAYPIQKFDTPVDLSGYDGIAFDLESDIEDLNSFVGLMLIEPNQTRYFLRTPFIFGKRRVVFLFRDMGWGSFSAIDPNHQLDLNQISAVKLGLNTRRNEVHFEAGHFELVKFTSN